MMDKCDYRENMPNVGDILVLGVGPTTGAYVFLGFGASLSTFWLWSPYGGLLYHYGFRLDDWSILRRCSGDDLQTM